MRASGDASRASPGGGELIDQGSHLIDLSRWFLGDLSLRYAAAPTYFWDISVDDNCFLALEAANGQMAWLHASLDGVEELVLVRVGRPQGKARDRRSGRKLWRGTADVLSHAAGNGSARDDDVGIPALQTTHGTPSLRISSTPSKMAIGRVATSTTQSQILKLSAKSTKANTHDHCSFSATHHARWRRH